MTQTTQAKPVTARIPAELAERIDRLRGLVPREAYIRDVLTKAITALEAEQH